MIARRLVPLALLLASCALPLDAEWLGPYASSDWFPLAQGSSWTYALSADGQPAGTLEARVEASTRAAGITRAAVATTFRDGRAGPERKLVTRYRQEQGRVWLDTPEASRELLRLPPQPGARWSNATEAHEVVGYERLVSPVGDFPRALHVRATQGDRSDDRWYVAGGGLVKATHVAAGRRWEALVTAYRIAYLDSPAPQPSALPEGSGGDWFPPLDSAPAAGQAAGAAQASAPRASAPAASAAPGPSTSPAPLDAACVGDRERVAAMVARIIADYNQTIRDVQLSYAARDQHPSEAENREVTALQERKVKLVAEAEKLLAPGCPPASPSVAPLPWPSFSPSPTPSP